MIMISLFCLIYTFFVHSENILKRYKDHFLAGAIRGIGLRQFRFKLLFGNMICRAIFLFVNKIKGLNGFHTIKALKRAGVCFPFHLTRLKALRPTGNNSFKADHMTSKN